MSEATEKEYKPVGITLKLFIEYNENDNLANISKLMMDLDPDNKTIVLLFEYILPLDKLEQLQADFNEFQDKKTQKKANSDLDYFLQKKHSNYFCTNKKTIEFNIQDKKENEDVFIDLKKEEKALKDVINYQYINADRDVSNKESGKSLSLLSSKIYRKIEADERQKNGIEEFKDALSDTDEKLGGIYKDIFQDVIEKVKNLGGIKPNDTKIKITSTLQHKELLEGNTTVMYEHDDKHDLPESYNGLGYMNLISMIFEIEILLNKFKKKKDEKPADINILFIEEPEAHTHPQMQYIFINNIKTLLKDGIIRDDGEKRDLQYIISTHSSHIVAESDFDDIKYLKIEKNSVIAKNLKGLEKEHKDEAEKQNYKFLKQYLTLHRAELFFADKAIFIEGDTERILLPAMMKKIDQDNSENPLLSQNISIIEVGNYSQVFEKFIDFIGVKSLIITDIDSAKRDRTKCKVADEDAVITTNPSLKFFYGKEKELDYFKKAKLEDMTLKKNPGKKWVKDKTGHLLCVYQINEKNSEGKGYYARSFEDSFFHINREFITDDKNNFKSLKNKKYLTDPSEDAYDLSEKCIDKKPTFAIEILLNSETDDKGKQFTNWKIPDYIEKGLLWLKKD